MPSGGAIISNNGPGLSTPTQKLVGSQIFGQNQHLTGSNDVGVVV
jgi:hypothetical protein